MSIVEELTEKIMLRRPDSDQNSVRQAIADLIIVLKADFPLLDRMIDEFND